MDKKIRRRQFLINKSLQFRYMFTLTFTLMAVILVSLAGLYLGIWGGILSAFSDEKIQNDLIIASQLQQYEEARLPVHGQNKAFSILSNVRQAERLSQRQKEIFKDILDETSRGLIGKLILLFIFIAWGTIFLSHKIAGPLYRFQKTFEQVAGGDLSVRCYLRKFDEAKPVAKTINQALGLLDTSIARLKIIIRENEKKPEFLVERLKEDLSKFKTTS